MLSSGGEGWKSTSIEQVDDERMFCRTAFRRELLRLRRLQQSHLVRIIAVCSYGAEQRLNAIVVEYPSYGDLKRYLRQNFVGTAAAFDATGTTSRQPLSRLKLVASIIPRIIIITLLFHTIADNPQLHNKLPRRTAQMQLNTKNQL